MKIKYIPIVLIVFFLALGGGVGRQKRDSMPGELLQAETAAQELESSVPEITETQEAAEDRVVTVYICGYVRDPGVYRLPEGSRVLDALDAAGGFREEADEEYWNLAELLVDGTQIRIPSVEESASLPKRECGTSAASDGRVNLNTADAASLMTLNGIGAARAEAIIAYREKNGPFRSIEDVMLVSGIKEAAFAKIKEDITVG